MLTLIRNIGVIVSGDIAAPLLPADSILVRDGRIAAVGRGLDEVADTVIDARGSRAAAVVKGHGPAGGGH